MSLAAVLIAFWLSPLHFCIIIKFPSPGPGFVIGNRNDIFAGRQDSISALTLPESAVTSCSVGILAVIVDQLEAFFGRLLGDGRDKFLRFKHLKITAIFSHEVIQQNFRTVFIMEH